MNSMLGNSVPGIRSDRTYTPRECKWSQAGATYLPAGRIIDASQSRDPLNTGDIATLRPGTLMGKITATGLYRPAIVGVSAAAYVDNDTTITVSAAVATEIARLKADAGGGDLSMKFIGPPTAAGTVAATAITVTAVGATTITIADLNLAKVTGSLLTLADGSETPLGVLDEHVRVTDIDGNNIDAQLSRLLIAGQLMESYLVNWPADTSTKAYLRGLLNAPTSGCGPFIFDGNF